MPGNSGTQVISRVFALLQSFDRANPELSLAELARKNKLHPTTAYRILQALVEEGFLIQDAESTRYSLGYGLVMLGELAKQGNALLKLVYPYAEKLAQITGESITIEVLNRNMQVDPVLYIPSSHRVSDQQPPHGKPMPAHCTSTGKVQLAYLPPVQLESILSRGLQALTPYTITDPARLKEQLVKVREQGYATVREELEIDLVAMASPIFDINARVVAGISVGGPSSRLTEKRISEIAPRLVEIAGEISEKMGYRCKDNASGNRY
jgi:IclR family transcriptional regulator, acetate operon repressor